MIEDMLDLARARVGAGIAVRRVRGDLEAPLRRVVDECAAAYPDRQIDWETAGDFVGDWDTDRLSQVASNLIRNALRHGDAHGLVRVSLDGRAVEAIRFAVANRGHISPELLPHIFDPFRGREEPSSRGEGLGIGLFIVRQIVLAHRGTVDVSSTPEDGTTFVVTLPRGESPL